MKPLFRDARTYGALAGLAVLSAAIAQGTQAQPATPADAFRAECRSKAQAADRAQSISVPGRDGWRFLAPELRHIGAGRFWGEAAATASQATRPEDADPLPAILDFKAQLDRAGIELLLVPVPPKAIIYPDKLSARLALKTSVRLDSASLEFYELLRQSGVPVLDLTPEFLARRAEASPDPLYCKQDSHWSGRGCVLAARSIAAAISQRPWLQSVPKVKWTQSWKRVAISGDLSPTPSTREKLPLRFVGTLAGADIRPVETSRSSPIVLLGDSHNLVFHAGDDMHARGAGLPDQLAAELGVAVDVIAVRGSGATPARSTLARRVRADPNYLGRKKLIVWCFGAREFTQSQGWRKLPLLPQP